MKITDKTLVDDHAIFRPQMYGSYYTMIAFTEITMKFFSCLMVHNYIVCFVT